ncbi:MAG: sigma-70 family RNA polymerase sigma factor [Acidobacteriaceae bacterium]|nr:sigma-70 family RNA polymerase sigma factor [Acidobacteriaceae bacterium]
MRRERQSSDSEWIGSLSSTTAHKGRQTAYALLDGDEQAFAEIYRSCSGPVYRFALYMTGDRHLAEEVTQETFLFLLANASSFDPARGSVLGWLLGVARNGSRRVLACSSENDALDDLSDPEIPDDSDPFEELAQRELVENVRRAVGSLPPALREVVILCELQELEYKETAAVLGCPIGTVRSRMNRARALLLGKLKARCSA